MLPTLSRLSVRSGPESRFRHRCSTQYLRISPLHWVFHPPLPTSSPRVSDAPPELSPGLSHPTPQAAYAPFTPSDSEQRLPPPYYRGCWHGVGRSFLQRYSQSPGLFTLKTFVPLDRSLRPRGPSSSTRRCFVRVSSIAKNSPLLPPVGVWAVSQSQCGRSPSQVGYPSEPWWSITPPTS